MLNATKDPCLVELEQKRRQTGRLRCMLKGIQNELQEEYGLKKASPPIHPESISPWNQELEDLLYDIKLIEDDRGKATNRLLQYHREIQEYKERNPEKTT